MRDLIERLRRAVEELLDLAETAKSRSDYDNQWRLEAKADGVRLALSYAQEEQRQRDDAVSSGADDA